MLEQISDILQNMGTTWTTSQDFTPPTTDADGFVSAADYQGQPGVPEPQACPFCGATLYRRGVLVAGRVMWTPTTFPCTCPESVAAIEAEMAKCEAEKAAKLREEENRKMQARVKRVVGQSGMGERFLRRTFDTFQETDTNRRALAACQRYAERFDDCLPKSGGAEPGRNGLFISGPPGTGKTHLAAAIANHLLAQGRPVICMTSIDLLARIRATFKKAGADVDESEVLHIYKSVPLLVIDDLGKESATDWSTSTLYNIVNGRYESYRPVAVTTNYSPAALINRMTPRASGGDDTTARALVDRLLEICSGISLTGESWRGRRKR